MSAVQVVVFRLDSRRYALALAAVERIIRAVEVVPLPGAPPVVLGAIDIAGRVVPVLNIRRRFQLPERAIDPADHFLIARANGSAVALVIDEAEGVITADTTDVDDVHAVPGVDAFPGVIRLADGLVLVHDPDRFLSLDEARAMERAVDEAQ